MNLPSTIRNTSALSLATWRLVGGMPLYSPSWAPRHRRAAEDLVAFGDQLVDARVQIRKRGEIGETAAPHACEGVLAREIVADGVQGSPVQCFLAVAPDECLF
jgi:hypothetical protein